MIDPFSTAAGAVSVVDVALRACVTIYDSIRYIQGAQELSARLQRTVQSVESILQNLNTFVAQFRQSPVNAAHPASLPDAVNHGIISIRADLDELLTLLPTSRKVKWVLNRKRLAVVVQKLENCQVTLLLALQSVAQ